MTKINEAPATTIIIQPIDHQILKADGLMAVMLRLDSPQKLSESGQKPRAKAHYPAIRTEEILRPDGRSQHEIVVEIKNMLAHLRDIPEHSLYGVGIEHRQGLLIALKYDAMIYDFYLGTLSREILLYERTKLGILAVRHNEYLPYERSKAEYGSHTVLDLPDTLVTGCTGDIVVAGSHRSHVFTALSLQGRIVTIHPGKQGIYLVISHFIQYSGICPVCVL